MTGVFRRPFFPPPRQVARWLPAQVGLLAADAATFTLTGQDAALRAARLITASAGALTLSGQAAGLTAARVLSASAGAFTLSGQAAGLTAARLITASAGTLTLSGQAAELSISRAAGGSRPRRRLLPWSAGGGYVFRMPRVRPESIPSRIAAEIRAHEELEIWGRLHVVIHTGVSSVEEDIAALDEHPVAQQLAAGVALTSEQRTQLLASFPGHATVRVGTSEELPDAELWRRYRMAADSEHQRLATEISALSLMLRDPLVELDPSFADLQCFNVEISSLVRTLRLRAADSEHRLALEASVLALMLRDAIVRLDPRLAAQECFTLDLSNLGTLTERPTRARPAADYEEAA